MPRTGENIYKRKDGRWEGRYVKGHKTTGKAIYGYVYAYSYKDAKIKLNLAVSGKPPSTRCKASGITFSELAELWLGSQKARVKKSTYNKYNNLLRSYVFPHIGEIGFETLSTARIAELCDYLLSSGGQNRTGLSEKTVSDMISVIRSVVQYAKNMGYHCSFDVRAVQMRPKTRELHILSQLDQKRMYLYLQENPCIHNTGLLICMLTGLRIGEVCALCWEDISFSDHTMYVHQTAQRIQDDQDPNRKTKLAITSPKSVSGKRVIPIPQNLETVLRNMESTKSGFVLSKDGTHLTEPRVLQYHFKKILKELGMEEVNFHILRHTFATRCIELGFDVKSLSEILGHSSVSITMNKYVHPSMALKQENMQRISSLFAVK